MSAHFGTEDEILNLGSLNLGAGAATIVFAPGRKSFVKRIILVTTTAQATAGAVLTFGVRNVDDTSSTTIGTATTPAVMAVNSVHKVDVAGVKSAVVLEAAGGISQVAQVTMGRVNGYQTNLPGEIEVNPGQEFFLSSGGEGDTGVAQVYVEYTEDGTAASVTDIAVTFS